MSIRPHRKLLLSVVLKNLKEAADPRNLFSFPAELIRYGRDLGRFRAIYSGPYRLRLLPVLFERSGGPNSFDPHYIYQALWATQRIFSEKRPRFHVDVSSHLHFAVQLSGGMTVFQVEFHPAGVKSENFGEIRANLLNLPFGNRSIDSLSCLHVVEHIGLGRYGDPLDPDGCWKALDELRRVLAREGTLYLSLPVGKPAVCFNGGWIFAARDVLERLSSLKLLEFSFVNDAGRLIEYAEPGETETMACALGMFRFRKSFPYPETVEGEAAEKTPQSG